MIPRQSGIPRQVLLDLNRVATRGVLLRQCDNAFVVILPAFVPHFSASAQLKPCVASLALADRAMLFDVLVVFCLRIPQRPCLLSLLHPHEFNSALTLLFSFIPSLAWLSAFFDRLNMSNILAMLLYTKTHEDEQMGQRTTIWCVQSNGVFNKHPSTTTIPRHRSIRILHYGENITEIHTTPSCPLLSISPGTLVRASDRFRGSRYSPLSAPAERNAAIAREAPFASPCAPLPLPSFSSRVHSMWSALQWLHPRWISQERQDRRWRCDRYEHPPAQTRRRPSIR